MAKKIGMTALVAIAAVLAYDWASKRTSALPRIGG